MRVDVGARRVVDRVEVAQLAFAHESGAPVQRLRRRKRGRARGERELGRAAGAEPALAPPATARTATSVKPRAQPDLYL